MGTSSSHALAVRRTSQKQMTDYEKFADFVPRHLRTGLPVSIFDIDSTQESCKDTFTDRRCMHTLAADIASGKAVLPPIRISRKFGHKRFRSADNRRLFLYKAMQLDIRSVPYEVIRWTEEFDNNRLFTPYRGATAKARSSYNDAPATTHRLKPFAPPTLVRATGLRSSTHRPSLRTARRPTTAFLGRSSTCFTSLWLWSF